ncbi:NAD(P)H-binding protein [Streptomyces sp. NBC_00239]|uniref:NAD(P)H-binding protein n=1 Tax=Streptomyces sp. NBC_00239 TaxID=2903640 RepID=UPI002E2927CC|nr:NAD(P)H-binding protein [Streptomyces sp. NBC_00239]
MTTLVTGSRGAVARGLAGLLQEAGLPHRLASRDPQDPGTVRCDLTDPGTFPAALDGATSVFLYAEPAAADAFLKEAGAAGVEHIVLLSSSSVLAHDAEDNALAASHLDAERALLASPIRSTLLRPGAFASNSRGWARSIASGDPVRMPYPGAHSDPVHEADIAEAAFAVLTDPALGGRAHTLTGPHSLTFATQLALIAAALGRPIPVETVTPDVWKSDVEAFVPAPYADALLDHWAAHDGLPVAISDGVEQLTGHPARSFEAWVDDHLADFRAH